MHIGYMVGVYPAKSETWISHEINGLRSRGHQVTISTVRAQARLHTCDFIVCHFAVNAGFANNANRPFVLIPHAYDIWPSDGLHLKNAVKNCANLRAVGCISNYHRERFISWGIPESLLVDWPCAIDTGLFYPAEDGFGDLVIAGGRNVPKKGLELALEAWPDVVLFGDHPRAIGWQTPEQLAALMRRAWCMLGTFVVDRRGDMDGLPLALLEAGAVELTVICTRIAGLADLAGMVTYVEPDPIQIRQAIEAEPHEPNKALHDHVLSRHSIAAVIANILKIGASF